MVTDGRERPRRHPVQSGFSPLQGRGVPSGHGIQGDGLLSISTRNRIGKDAPFAWVGPPRLKTTAHEFVGIDHLAIVISDPKMDVFESVARPLSRRSDMADDVSSLNGSK